MTSSTPQKTILLTGAAGTIGSSLRQHLGKYYHFRCLDKEAISEAEDTRIIDITDFEAVLEAMAGVDGVIHLAANPDVDQPWEDVYQISIGGTYNVFEAARRSGVKKIVYASSNHASGGWEREEKNPITPDLPVRPDSLYGVGKAFGEALGRFYADRYEMSIICLRIGSFAAQPQPQNRSERIVSTWCSPRDLVQLVRLSLEKEYLGCQIFYGVSDNSDRFWEISNAQKLLGYSPQDDAEKLLPE